MQARFNYLQATTEREATEFLARDLAAHNVRQEGAPRLTGHLVYKVAGRTVCHQFYRNARGCSTNKMARVRQMVRTGRLRVLHGNAGRAISHRQYDQYATAVAFWCHFFEYNCQRPHDGIRLWPTNKSYRYIYDNYFRRHFEVVGMPGQPIPCLSTFKCARHHPMFDDVKRRATHNHARCMVCSELTARRLAMFNNQAEERQWLAELQLHEDAAKMWRVVEQSVITEGRHKPSTKLVLSYDDTSPLGLPNLTNRPPKNMTTTRLQFIPLHVICHSSGEQAYVYMAKNRFDKTVNRLLTVLYTMLRKIKMSDNHPSAAARDMVCMADNASENKNSEMLAFASDIVSRDVLDSVEFLFGLPGHTHNNNDGQHHVHNKVLGNFTTGTLGHHVALFEQAWQTDATRPTPCLLDVQYNWKQYYGPVIDKLAGFTKTITDPNAAHAFRVCRGQSGVVCVYWKHLASDRDWLGVDGTSSSPGFVVLRSKPTGVPKVVEPASEIMHKKHYKQLMGNTMRQFLEAEGLEGAQEWLRAAAKRGVVPIRRQLDGMRQHACTTTPTFCCRNTDNHATYT